MPTFTQIKKAFNNLPNNKKEALFKDIYNFSPDIKLFLENRFFQGISDRKFIEQMEKETIEKVYKSGIPGTPDGRKVNSIINKAKKSRVNIETMIELEKLAYRGFIEFLNEYGGGPETFDEMAYNHLKIYLNLVKNEIKNKDKQDQIFQDLKIYLLRKDNMYTDELYSIFNEITGIAI